MTNVFFTSDWHFGHDKPFIYEKRGFTSIEEHDHMLIQNHNSIVKPDDEVYVLGDLVLGDIEKGFENLSKLNGRLYVILGNHETKNKIINCYNKLPNLVEIHGYATIQKFGKYFMYLSHFPTMTANGFDKNMKYALKNLHGHTHSKDKTNPLYPWMVNVAVDAWNNFPAPLEDVIKIFQTKVGENR